jgi:uncharacterized membrane protein
VSETWVDFELREPGDSDSESVTVTNSGDRELKGLDVDLSGDRGFSMNSDCSDELAPGESCEVEVTFEEDEPGRYDAELQVDSNGGSARVHISGELKNRDRS